MMKRSEINSAYRQAKTVFAGNGWHLPPNPRWDITDFGLGDFPNFGLCLINLADEPEYCEKLMYASKGQVTPAHTHLKKKEDIICRAGQLAIQLWNGPPSETIAEVLVNVCGQSRSLDAGAILLLNAGERVTLNPGVYHAFWPLTDNCVIGEVSTSNNDATDNIFENPDVGRYPEIEEDEDVLVRLISD